MYLEIKYFIRIKRDHLKQYGAKIVDLIIGARVPDNLTS
jgi:hypothetical protein